MVQEEGEEGENEVEESVRADIDVALNMAGDDGNLPEDDSGFLINDDDFLFDATPAALEDTLEIKSPWYLMDPTFPSLELAEEGVSTRDYAMEDYLEDSAEPQESAAIRGAWRVPVFKGELSQVSTQLLRRDVDLSGVLPKFGGGKKGPAWRRVALRLTLGSPGPPLTVDHWDRLSSFGLLLDLQHAAEESQARCHLALRPLSQPPGLPSGGGARGRVRGLAGRHVVPLLLVSLVILLQF